MEANPDREANASDATVRLAQSGDAIALAELMTLLGYPSTVDEMDRRMTESEMAPGAAAFVAELNDRVVGVASVQRIPTFHADGALGRITSLVVATEFRQRGIGRLLVGAAEEFARLQGCTRVEITSGEHRPEAHAFYEHLGYRVEGRRFLKHGDAQ